MEKFEASNGWTVGPLDGDGDRRVESSEGDFEGYLPEEHIPVLREYFAAERDRELGRWRDPEHSGWIVYPPHASGSLYTLIDEETGDSWVDSKSEANVTSPYEHSVVLARYLAAHKPKRCLDEIATPGYSYFCDLDAGHDGEHRQKVPGSTMTVTWF